MKRPARTPGFTLIELLVVIAMLGILIAAVLMGMNTAKRKAFDTKARNCAHQIRTQQERVRTTQGGFGAFSALGSLPPCAGITPEGQFTALHYRYEVKHPQGQMTYTATDSDLYVDGVGSSGKDLSQDASNGTLGPPTVTWPTLPTAPTRTRINYLAYVDEGNAINSISIGAYSNEGNHRNTCTKSPCILSYQTSFSSTISAATTANFRGASLNTPALHLVTIEGSDGSRRTSHYFGNIGDYVDIPAQPGVTYTVTDHLRPIGGTLVAEVLPDRNLSLDAFRLTSTPRPLAASLNSTYHLYAFKPEPLPTIQCFGTVTEAAIKAITEEGLGCQSTFSGTFTGNDGKTYRYISAVAQGQAAMNCFPMIWSDADRQQASTHCSAPPPMTIQRGKIREITLADTTEITVPLILEFGTEELLDWVITQGEYPDITVSVTNTTNGSSPYFTVLQNIDYAKMRRDGRRMITTLHLPNVNNPDVAFKVTSDKYLRDPSGRNIIPRPQGRIPVIPGTPLTLSFN